MNIKGIELKKFHEFKYGHGDSMTFDAEIWMDGKKIGHVGNDGWGGPNLYNFENDEVEESFYAMCKEWMKESGQDYVEPEDILLEEIIEGNRMEKTKIRNQKKGYRFTVLCKKGKKVYEKLGNYEHWDEEWLVGFRDEKDIKPYLKKERVEFYKVI